MSSAAEQPSALVGSAAQGRTLRVRGQRPLTGTAKVPVDIEIMQRALLLAAIAEGRSELLDAPQASHLATTATALQALGVPISWSARGVEIQGVTLDGLSMPSGAVACDRSWTTLALMAGLISTQHFGTRISTHASLATRSVEHIVGPLRARGAQIAGHSRAGQASDETLATAPISIAPLLQSESLHALDCTLPVPDAAAKAAVLISALYARGTTTVAEPLVSPDHCERMFVGLGLPLRQLGAAIHFDPSAWDRRIPALRGFTSPGCATCAAYACAAVQLIPGSRIALGGAGLNPSRTGFLDVLRLWGSNVQVLQRGDAAQREPIADLIVKHGGLRGGVLGGELLLRARGELNALALLGSVTHRPLQLFDLEHAASELDPQAHKLQTMLRAFGIDAQRREDALVVGATPTLQAAHVNAAEQAELGMAAVVLGLAAEGETVVEEGADAIELAHPGFLHMLQALGAELAIT